MFWFIIKTRPKPSFFTLGQKGIKSFVYVYKDNNKKKSRLRSL